MQGTRAESVRPALDGSRSLHASSAAVTHAQELNGYLAKGLGRAHVVLEKGADASQCKALVAACLRDDAMPLEGSRAGYLLELVRLVGASGDLASALADPFADGPSGDDLEQRFELVGLLARDGVPGMREVLYRGQVQLIDRWLAEPVEWVSTVAARHLIALDGIRGAVFVFGQLGRAALAGASFFSDQELIDAALDSLGDEQAGAILEARANDPGVDAYLLATEAPFVRIENPLRPAGWSERPWTDAQATIERSVRGTDSLGAFASHWGEKASEEDLALAAQALVDLPKDDLELLRAYLSVFRKRPFPLDPALLIALLDDPRRFVSTYATNALEQISHPAVRAVALRMAAHGPHRQCALGLLARNWNPGDELIAEDLLRAAEGQRKAIVHTLGYGLRAVIDVQPPTPELVPALRLAYELEPCSSCRTDFVAALLRLSALPDDLRAECRWDANEQTRQLVSSEA